jgi:hypothetical protein
MPLLYKYKKRKLVLYLKINVVILKMEYIYYTQLETDYDDDNGSEIYDTKHNCIGIFSKIEKAEIRAKKFYKKHIKNDSHHYYINIYKILIDLELDVIFDKKYYIKTI